MAAPPEPLRMALMPIVEAIRRRLRDLDTKEVPAPLRKVVAYAGGRLPPPLLKSLLLELDRNEWLRSKLAEIADDGDDIGLADFLDRPPGWWMAVAEGAAAAAAAAPVADVAGDLAAAEGRLEESKRRLAQLRSQNAALTKELKAARKELRTRPEGGEPEDRADDLTKEVEHLREELAAERARRSAGDAKIEELRRRKRRRAPTTPTQGDTRVVGLSDPVTAARRLDIQAAAFAAAARAGSPPVPPDDEFIEGILHDELTPLALPAGIAPDSPEAIRWLIKDAGPVPVIVDGYNVTFLMEPDQFGAPEARKRLVGELERLVRHARAAHRVMIVFDSALEGGSQPGLTAGGVEIRFATNAASADDEIVALVRSLDGRSIVITNDRELRERVDVRGALALWGSAFVDWALG